MRLLLAALLFFPLSSWAVVETVCKKVRSTAGSDLDLDISRSESVLLTLAKLHLKDPGGLQDFERAVNKFFEEHRGDPEVRQALKEFVVDFVTDQRDALPGDYPVKRPVRDWRHFFLQHSHYLITPRTDGKYDVEAILGDSPALPPIAIDEARVKSMVWGHGQVWDQKLEDFPGEMFPNGVNVRRSALHGKVLANLKNEYEFRKHVRGTATPERLAEARKTYLQIVLLTEANTLWQNEMRGN